MRRDRDGFQPMEFQTGESWKTSLPNHWLPVGKESQGRKSPRYWMLLGSLVVLVAVLVVFSLSKVEPLELENDTIDWDPTETAVTSAPTEMATQETTEHIHHTESNFPDPPTAYRDEEYTVQFGVAPSDWDPSLPRQSEESTVPLLDPPKLVSDPYFWLRDDDRSNTQVLDYLQAENNYTQARLGHLDSLRDTLYQEMMTYVDETSHSVPTLQKSYFYYRRTVEGLPYPLHCRAPRPDPDERLFQYGEYVQANLAAWDGKPESPILPGEQVYMDENVLAEGHEFFDVGALEISPSEDLLAYSVDVAGNELYQLVVIQISTNDVVFEGGEDLIISGSIQWGLSDSVLFYCKPDYSQRPYQVYRRDLNNNTEKLLVEELDVTYWVGFETSADQEYLLIVMESSESSELYYLPLDATEDLEVTSIASRRPDVLYTAEHFHGNWWILSNVNDPDGNMEFWIMPAGNETESQWTRILDPETNTPLLDGVSIDDFAVFERHIVIEGREDGMQQIWVLTVEDDSSIVKVKQMDFPNEAAHSVSVGWNPEYATSVLILNYVSLVTPSQNLQVDLDAPNRMKNRLVVYETPVPGYQKEKYACQRMKVLSRDGETMIPVSLVYHKSTMASIESGTTRVPLHLYAYGAYGSSMDDTFSSSILPLLDRGAVYAVAHVRGGGENGRSWYIDGKLLRKHNTFDDFVDVGRYFVDQKWTSADLLSCEGRSAGGLTMGASINQAPDLFRAAILGVPFVDLMVTMVDASIPLTTNEWREWGNPSEVEYYEPMMSYSPMNNVKPTTYPSMLLLAGLFDPRVAYWEPAKLTATLRHTTTENPRRPICLKTDMNSGHFSASDRYKHIRERAFEYAFILDQLGVE